MASLERFANPTWSKGGVACNGEKFAVIKPVPNKVLAVRPKMDGVTEDSLVSRGITVMDSLSVNANIVYPSGPHRQTLYGPQEVRAFCQSRGITSTSNMSRQDARDFVLTYLAPFAVGSDQLAEGYGEEESKFIVYDHTQQRDWMDEALAEKVGAMNPKGLFIAGYDNKCPGARDVFTNTSNPMNFANTLNSQGEAKAGLDFYNRSVSNVSRANFQAYYGGGIGEPTSRRHEYVRTYALTRLGVASDASLPPVDFTWLSLESPGTPAAWIPGHAWVIETPNGTLYKNNEAWVSPNFALIGTLISFIVAGGTVCWERPDWFSDDIADAHFEQFQGAQPDDVWVPKNGEPRPVKRNGHRQYANRPMSVNDGIYKGGLFAGEMNARAGFNFKYVAFRTIRNNVISAWKEPLQNNKATVLQSGANFEGMAWATEIGNDVAGTFTDPSAPLAGQKVEMRLPSGKIVAFDHYGSEPVCFGGQILSNYTMLNRKDAIKLQ